jgi:Helix-turn-helix domain of resolvase
MQPHKSVPTISGRYVRGVSLRPRGAEECLKSTLRGHSRRKFAPGKLLISCVTVIEAAETLPPNPDISVTQIAHRLGVSPATLYRYILAARTAFFAP